MGAVIFFRISLVCCGIALAFAAFEDLLLICLVRVFGGIGIFADNDSSLNRGFLILIAVAWVLSLVVGWIIARRLNLVPHL